MSMEDKHIDELFREHLEKEVVPFEPHAWEEAEKLIQPKKKVFWTWKTYTISALIAVITALLMFQQRLDSKFTSENIELLSSSNSNTENKQPTEKNETIRLSTLQNTNDSNDQKSLTKGSVAYTEQETEKLEFETTSLTKSSYSNTLGTNVQSKETTNISNPKVHQALLNNQELSRNLVKTKKMRPSGYGSPVRNQKEVEKTQEINQAPIASSEVKSSEENTNTEIINDGYIVSHDELLFLDAKEENTLYHHTREVLNEYDIDFRRYCFGKPSAGWYVSAFSGISQPLNSKSTVFYADYQYDITGIASRYMGFDVRYDRQKYGLSVGFQKSKFQFNQQIMADEYAYSYDTSVIVRSQEYYVEGVKYWLVEEVIDSTRFNTQLRKEILADKIFTRNVQIPLLAYYKIDSRYDFTINTLVGVIGNNVTSLTGSSFDSGTQSFSELPFSKSSEWNFAAIAGVGINYNVGHRFLIGLESKFALRTEQSDQLLNDLNFSRINSELRLSYRFR